MSGLGHIDQSEVWFGVFQTLWPGWMMDDLPPGCGRSLNHSDHKPVIRKIRIKTQGEAWNFTLFVQATGLLIVDPKRQQTALVAARSSPTHLIPNIVQCYPTLWHAVIMWAQTPIFRQKFKFRKQIILTNIVFVQSKFGQKQPIELNCIQYCEFFCKAIFTNWAWY